MSERNDPQRRAILGAVAGLAGLAIANPKSASAQSGSGGGTAPATGPRQAWASVDRAVAIGPNAAPVADPLDILMIQQAFARYGMGHDEGLAPVLASLFTADAVVEVADGAGKPFQIVRGHEAVVANFANTFRQQADQRRHCFSNIIVEEMHGNQARALAYAIVSAASRGTLIMGASVIYTSELRKEQGIWKFSRLFIGMDAYTTPKPKV